MLACLVLQKDQATDSIPPPWLTWTPAAPPGSISHLSGFWAPGRVVESETRSPAGNRPALSRTARPRRSPLETCPGDQGRDHWSVLFGFSVIMKYDDLRIRVYTEINSVNSKVESKWTAANTSRSNKLKKNQGTKKLQTQHITYSV